MQVKRFLCLIMAAVMAVTFVSCGSSDEKEAVADYVKKSETGIITAFNSDGAGRYGNVLVKNEETKVVIECSFKDDAPEDVEEMLNDGFESTKGLLKGALTKMQEEEPAVTALIFRYLDKNGKVLAEKEVK